MRSTWYSVNEVSYERFEVGHNEDLKQESITCLCIRDFWYNRGGWDKNVTWPLEIQLYDEENGRVMYRTRIYCKIHPEFIVL